MSLTTIKEKEFRKLNSEDYYKNYLQLLSQLTVCNYESISYDEFCCKLEQINKNNTNIYVLEFDNKIIATATLILEHKFIHNLSLVGHIEDVVVDSEHRGKQIGKAIIEHLLVESKNAGCYKVILDCTQDKVEFYSKCDFSIKGIQMSKYF